MEKPQKRIKILSFALIFIVSFLGGLSITLVRSHTVRFITITANGYSPSHVTINKGQEVIFKNNDNIPHWPASDSHPTHDIYAAFDPKEPINPGGQWSFTFNQSGTWEFHDHLNPLLTGKIVVRGEELAIDTSSCKDNTNKSKCWDKLFDNIIEQQGLEQAFSTLESIYLSDQEFASNCHGYVHKLGEEAYNLFSKGKDVPISDKASYCAYGFYHGFIETLLHTTGDMQTARDFCTYVDKNSEGRGGAFFACYHGMGHGVVDGSDERVWGDDYKMVEPGLKLCDEVSEDEILKDACASGVFNSIAVLYKDPKYKLDFRRTQPYALCDDERISQVPYFKKPCVEEMNTYILSITGSNLENSLDFSKRIADEQSAIYATQSVAGYYAFFSNKPSEFPTTIKTCKALPSHLHLGCITGYAAGLVEHGKPGLEYENAIAFCQQNLLNSEEKQNCMFRIFYYFSNLYPSDKLKYVCDYAKEENISYCQ